MLLLIDRNDETLFIERRIKNSLELFLTLLSNRKVGFPKDSDNEKSIFPKVEIHFHL